jgi:hypothetical protein
MHKTGNFSSRNGDALLDVVTPRTGEEKIRREWLRVSSRTPFSAVDPLSGRSKHYFNNAPLMRERPSLPDRTTSSPRVALKRPAVKVPSAQVGRPLVQGLLCPVQWSQIEGFTPHPPLYLRR